MARLVIATYSFSSRLKAVGIAEVQAETIVNELKNMDWEDVVTKEYKIFNFLTHNS